MASLSACTATGNPSRAASAIPSNSVRSSARGNSGNPESDMNALKPTAPASASAASSSRLPGTSPPHEREVGDRRGRQGGVLACELVGVDGTWRGVQRHVDEGRATACRERAAAAGRTFPVGPARLVEVHVRVHDTGKDVQPCRIDDLSRGRQLGADGRDAPVFDGQIGAYDAVGRHQQSAANQDVMHGARSQWVSQCTPTSRAAATSSSSTSSSG